MNNNQPPKTPYVRGIRLKDATIKVLFDETTPMEVVYDCAAGLMVEGFEKSLNKMKLTKKTKLKILKALDGQTVTPRELAAHLERAARMQPIY